MRIINVLILALLLRVYGATGGNIIDGMLVVGVKHLN
jgi:hypothetical protein